MSQIKFFFCLFLKQIQLLYRETPLGITNDTLKIQTIQILVIAATHEYQNEYCTIELFFLTHEHGAILLKKIHFSDVLTVCSLPHP